MSENNQKLSRKLIKNEWEFKSRPQIIEKRSKQISSSSPLYGWIIITTLTFILFIAIANIFHLSWNYIIIFFIISIFLGAIPFALGLPDPKDIGKKTEKEIVNWHFTNFQDPKLTLEMAKNLIKEILNKNKSQYNEESKKEPFYTTIIRFSIDSNNLNIRLVWLYGAKPYFLEIGIGPETIKNKTQIEKLKNIISNKFAEKFKN
jgi:hypothetical protein